MLKEFLTRTAQRAGFEGTRSRHRFFAGLFSTGVIDHVVDVGANRGEFLRLARSAGYDGGSSTGQLFDLAASNGLYPSRLFANSVTHWGAWIDADVVFVRKPA